MCAVKATSEVFVSVMFSSDSVVDYCKEWDNWNIVTLLTALGWHDQWWSLYNRMWQWRLVSCEAGTSRCTCMYDAIVEVLYCYKCVLLFVIQNKVNLFNFIITILEVIAIANALQLEAVRATSVLSRLITTPCQVRSRWTCPLQYYSVFATDTLLCAVTFDLKHWHCIASDMMKRGTKFERNPRWSYCNLNIWAIHLECHVTCFAWLWENFHKVWPLTTYSSLNYSVLYTLCHPVTLTIDPLKV